MAAVAIDNTTPLAGEDRSARRHRLWLSACVSAHGNADQVLIHNLSSTGVLFESTLELGLGDQIEIELPEAGRSPAEVVWYSDSFFGCEFASPIPASAVSASRLRSPQPQPAASFAPSTLTDEAVATAPDAADPYALAPLQKTVVIVGAAAVCWGLIIATIVYF